MSKRKIKRKIFTGLSFAVLLGLIMWFLLYGENIEIIKSVISGEVKQEDVQDTLHELGIRGYLTIVILSMLQVILMFLPAEPVQVLAGLSFGIPVGLLCCITGVILGFTVIFIAYKIYGERISKHFDKKLDIDIREYGNSGILTLVVLILYFLPAIPYGMICFVCATMKMKYGRYILINTLGAIPSELIGIALGHMAMSTSWITSLVVFIVLMVLLGVVMSRREKIMDAAKAFIKRKANQKEGRHSVRKYRPWRINLPYIVSRICLFGKVKCIYENRVGTPEKPSIVLINHGAFIDFVYAGSILRKYGPHFIVARLYFYHHFLASVLSGVGCFPKSMFTLDIESAKNSVKVLREGGMLAMMPEARLSTVGRFEDIQPQTYAFIKKSGVTVYCIKLEGDYLAKPKWADKIRRGSVVYTTFDTLITKEELENMDVEQIKARVEGALYYDEYDFLDAHPEIKYKTKNMALGLENVLTLCPGCNKRYTMKSEKNRIFCSCGMTAELDERYKFKNSYPFEKITDWYDYQTENFRKILEDDPDFELSSRVTYHLPSKDGKSLTYKAGEGVATLSRKGLLYKGTRDGEEYTKLFELENIYRLLFGAGENFEIYEGKEINYFRPEILSSSVDFYILSRLLKEKTV
jgi:uncharacterized membrane protein YdjX (TVP38/TMEM64 family)